MFLFLQVRYHYYLLLCAIKSVLWICLTYLAKLKVTQIRDEKLMLPFQLTVLTSSLVESLSHQGAMTTSG